MKETCEGCGKDLRPDDGKVCAACERAVARLLRGIMADLHDLGTQAERKENR